MTGSFGLRVPGSRIDGEGRYALRTIRPWHYPDQAVPVERAQDGLQRCTFDVTLLAHPR